jgi:SAM-dependent MidA family methyltransferase
MSDIATQSRYKGVILKDFDQVMQLEASPTLPQPDAESAAHCLECEAFIHARIAAAGGSISFAEYMQHALYAPGLGYYAAGTTKFGPGGDFVTAPEVSSLFGYVLARQCADVLAQIQGGSILELGAGSGRLAVDVLSRLDSLDVLPDHYDILEVSADLRDRQETLLRHELGGLAKRVRWLGEIPECHKGIVLANEVLDALPVERFVKRANLQCQRIRSTGSGFEVFEADAPGHVAAAVAAIETGIGHELAEGYVSEVSLAVGDWVRSLADALDVGAVFLFDYGLSRGEYYAVDRSDGWLRCHFRHHAHNNPTILAGIQDMTAWVDFTSVAEAVTAAGADIVGFVDQAHFLINAGLDAELERLGGLPEQRRVELSTEIKLLTLPSEMGEHFKCFAFSKGDCDPSGAFVTADRTHTL